MNHKFDSLHGLDFNDQQKEIADKFAKLVFDQPGWYRGTIDYMLDENGKVVRIDGLMVTMVGEQLPSEFFRREDKFVPFPDYTPEDKWNLSWPSLKTMEKQGCKKRLAPGQYWGYCGETDMGQSAPALCTECGGEYKLDDQKEIDK